MSAPVNIRPPPKKSQVERPNERVCGSYALRGWFNSEDEIAAHVDELRYREKLVNGVYVPTPELVRPPADDEYPHPVD